MLLNKNSFTGISLDAAGLIALADLTTISRRTALTGTASFLDVFFLAPGIHTQQDAVNINGGELPEVGAMHSGYTFRIENQATTYYLQGIGRPGRLVTVNVEEWNSSSSICDMLTPSNLLYFLGILMTLGAIVIFIIIRDCWALGLSCMLIFARFLNMIVVRRRTQIGWKGALEPGVQGDLIVLLSNDRWVRMRGSVDDLKRVTSGQWMRDQAFYENYASAFAKLLVFVAAALASNASPVGKLLMALLLLVSVALLGVCNTLTKDLQMFGRRVYVVGERTGVPYTRRLDMANSLIEETGRDDWALAMGLIRSPQVMIHFNASAHP